MLASCFHLVNFCFVAFLILTIFPPFSHPLSSNMSRFDSEPNSIAYEGDAMQADDFIELHTIGELCRVGRATYSKALHLWDSSTGILTDFTTRFSFYIGPLIPNSNYGDGLAFYMAPVGYPIPPNSAGGFLGLFNSTTGFGVPQNRIVHIEFDTFPNGFDPPMKHVGINVNSVLSLASTFFDIDDNNGNLSHALITYNGSTKTLSVFWSFNGSATTFAPNHSLSQTIDLMKVLPEWVTIGFSATTGLYTERHEIRSWEFSSTLNSPIVTRKGNKNIIEIVVVAGTCSFALVLIEACLCWLFIKKRKRKDDERTGNSVDFDLNKAAIPRRFDYQELVAATDGFADDKKLGRGGSGQVYKGILNNVGRVVAVKRIFPDFENSERVFRNEVKMISRLIHRNLVQFIGWCHEQGEFLLVYDYMPNGSLDTHLFGNKRILPWNTRYKIALGVVTAIHYLHEDAEQSVLHRDIKSANVLLDADFSIKLGDFGLAKLVDPRLRSQRTGLVGTLGYLAPEYINGGRASKESDIYSFGVVALEIASSTRTYQEREYHKPLENRIWKLYVEGNVLKAADEGLSGNFDMNEMIRLLIVGLWCTHPMDKERPKAAQVIKVLQLESPLPVLPHDMHNFGDHSPPGHVGRSNSFSHSLSLAALSMMDDDTSMS